MRPPTKTEIAIEKMLQAEADLQACVQGGQYNPEQHKQLLEAASVARCEFINQMEKNG